VIAVAVDEDGDPDPDRRREHLRSRRLGECGRKAKRFHGAVRRSCPIQRSAISKGRIMKLTEARIDSALSQLEAQAIPENHPATVQLGELFGDHTFFLDSGGLTILEPVKTDGAARGHGPRGQARALGATRPAGTSRRTSRNTPTVVVALDKAA
jgi:hypothetical protein